MSEQENANNNVIEISVTFPEGSFDSWVTGNGQEYPEAIIRQWESEYNQLVESAILEEYPEASVMVSEDSTYQARNEAWVEFVEGYEPSEGEFDEIQSDVLQIAEIENYIDVICQDVDAETIADCIEDGLETAHENREPFYVFKYNDKQFVVTERKDVYYFVEDYIMIDSIDDFDFGTLEQISLYIKDCL